MKKKKYEKPQMVVLEIKQTNILASSGFGYDPDLMP